MEAVVDEVMVMVVKVMVEMKEVMELVVVVVKAVKRSSVPFLLGMKEKTVREYGTNLVIAAQHERKVHADPLRLTHI